MLDFLCLIMLICIHINIMSVEHDIDEIKVYIRREIKKNEN